MGRGTRLINVKDITVNTWMKVENFDFVDVPFNNENIATEEDLFFVRSSVKLSGIALVSKINQLDENTIHCGFVIRFRPTSDLIDTDYLLYLFRSPQYRKRLIGLSSGTAIVNISQTVLKGLDFPIPPLEKQRKISLTLKNYDDLIENNLRRIKLLEDFALQFYKEWFVCLRFPGYEHTKIVKGVPDGWEKKKLGDICEEIKEIVLPENVDSDTPYIGLEHMPRKSITLSTWGKAEDVTSAKHRYRNGDILFGKIRPYFHKVGIALTDGIASSDAIVIRAFNEELQNLVLLTVSSDYFVADTSQRMKEGSKMPRADWKQMQQWPVLKPKSGLIASLNDQMNPIVAQLKTLVIQNIKLKQARDILLPKLMSGEVEVNV